MSAEVLEDYRLVFFSVLWWRCPLRYLTRALNYQHVVEVGVTNSFFDLLGTRFCPEG